MAALSYCHDKSADGGKAKREQRVVLRQIGQLRLMKGAIFRAFATPAEHPAR
jgi:hypothetical protein